MSGSTGIGCEAFVLSLLLKSGDMVRCTRSGIGAGSGGAGLGGAGPGGACAS